MSRSVRLAGDFLDNKATKDQLRAEVRREALEAGPAGRPFLQSDAALERLAKIRIQQAQLAREDKERG